GALGDDPAITAVGSACEYPLQRKLPHPFDHVIPQAVDLFAGVNIGERAECLDRLLASGCLTYLLDQFRDIYTGAAYYPHLGQCLFASLGLQCPQLRDAFLDPMD